MGATPDTPLLSYLSGLSKRPLLIVAEDVISSVVVANVVFT